MSSLQEACSTEQGKTCGTENPSLAMPRHNHVRRNKHQQLTPQAFRTDIVTITNLPEVQKIRDEAP